MGKIIQFSDKSKTLRTENINEALAHASHLFKENALEFKDCIAIMDVKKMRRLLEIKIIETLFKAQAIDVKYFLCGSYVAEFLTKLGSEVPESWFATDFVIKGKAQDIKQGANLCFIICSLFPKRADVRCMSQNDYQTLGQGLYLRFYYLTGAEIGYLMSRLFKQMVTVTEEAIKSIQ